MTQKCFALWKKTQVELNATIFKFADNNYYHYNLSQCRHSRKHIRGESKTMILLGKDKDNLKRKLQVLTKSLENSCVELARNTKI